MGNVCLGSGSCCKPDRSNGAAAYRGCHQGKSIDNPYLDPSPGITLLKMEVNILSTLFDLNIGSKRLNPILNNILERSGYHPALAKVDSAPSASVGMHGINTGLCGQTSAIHANSEASLLKIHHNKHDSTAASIMV